MKPTTPLFLLMSLNFAACAPEEACPTVNLATVFGQNDLAEITDGPAVLQPLGASVGLLAYTDGLRREDDGYRVDSLATRRQAHDLCSDVKFAEQPVFYSCTVFLVGEDTAVTAGHCLRKLGAQAGIPVLEPEVLCPDLRLVFDYAYDEAGNLNAIDDSQVYSCAEVVYEHYDSSGADIAVIRLDRATDRAPLIVSRTTPPPGSPLGIIGHPEGMPLKSAAGGAIQVPENGLENEGYFGHSLDVFSGLSGAPIFDLATLAVVGVHVRSDENYIVRSDMPGTCSVERTCDGQDCVAAEGTRVQAVPADLLPETLDPNGEPEDLRCPGE